MIDTYKIGDFFYSGVLDNTLIVNTEIKLLREHQVTITINSVLVPEEAYLLSIETDTKTVTIVFKAQRSGSLCVFRHSNREVFLELGTEKSREQNEKFFDKLVQFAQDLDMDRAASLGVFDNGVMVGDVKTNPFEDNILEFLNDEGKKTTLYNRAYKVASDFKFGVNRYAGAISLNLDDAGSFGDRSRFTIDVGVDSIFVQDVETGISIVDNKYTLIKSIESNSSGEILSLVLYRRLMDNKENKYNIQKAMIGTKSVNGRIIHGNNSYVCTVMHSYDFITLTATTLTKENNFNSMFSGSATIFIDLEGKSVPIYIQNNGILMKDYT